MSPNDPKKPSNSNIPPVDGGDDLPQIDLGEEAQIDLGDLSSGTGESSTIPLADLPESPSGQSLTSWTEVIRRQQEMVKQASNPGEKSPIVDAPSDRDLLARLAGEDAGRDKSGDTSEIPEAELPVFSGDEDIFPNRRSASEIDLGNAIPPGAGHSASQIGFDVLHPPSDAAGAMPFPEPEDLPPLGNSSFDAADLPFAPEDDGSSAQLGQLVQNGPTEDRSSILDVLLQESTPARSGSKIDQSDVWDFGQTPPIPAPSEFPVRSANRPPSSAESFDIPVLPRGAQASSSWETPDPDELGELIPESKSGLDAVVDLYSESAVPPPSLTDSGSLAISDEIVAEARRQSMAIESSSVDLSSRPSLSETDFDAIGQSKFGSEDIDMGLPAEADNASSSMVYRRGDPLLDNQKVLAEEFDRRRRDSDPTMQRPEIPPSQKGSIRPVRTEDSASGINRLQYMIRGTALGLILGGGGVLGAVYGGLIKSSSDSSSPPVADNTAEVVQLKKQLADSQVAVNATGAIKKALTDAGVNADAPDAAIRGLIEERSKLDAQAKALTMEVDRTKAMLTSAQKAAEDARAAELTAQAAAKKAADDLRTLKAASADAIKDVETAKKAAEDAKKMLADAMKAVDAAKQDTLAARKAADDLKVAAEIKDKEAADKLAIANKKADDLAKIAESAKASATTAQKAAEDAQKARETSDTTLATLTDRLAKAKFVNPKADSTALLKGIDDAIKAASTDATVALRDELTKAREAEGKLKTELTATMAKEVATAKAAEAAKAEAAKLAADAKLATMKLAEETQRAMKLSKDASDAIAKGEAAAKAAADSRAIADKATTELAKLKADTEQIRKDAEAAIKANEMATATAAAAKQDADRSRVEAQKLKAEKDRLANELDTLKDIASAVRNGSTNVSVAGAKPDVTKIAERAFGEGLRAYFAGQYSDAQSSFRRAIQFQPEDARYHYLLGAALWVAGNRTDAEAELKKGQDLEAIGRPGPKSVSAVLEKIQGPARQAINSFRP